MKISRILTGLVPALALLLTMSRPVVRAADDVPAIGAAAPDFTLSSQEGKKVSLHDFKGQWVVLYFYPKDMTPGCTIEAHNFQRDQKEYDAKKAAILGVSVDSVDSHVEFCTKENLTFKLLSDPDKKVVTEYGSTQKFGPNVVAARHTFLIDPKGVVRKYYPNVNANIQGHSAEVLAAIDELKKSS
ncbi:MAG TPA: peroxiredoxin [Bryobacteraceae bacterium]|jgi:peroxiredoxin Q/BCP|nr:peroxiredoxin [Bryobacteraceae bacterium]